MLLLALAAALPVGCSGDNGTPGPAGPPGPEVPIPPTVFDASAASPDELARIDVVSEITAVSIASPPVVTFSLTTSNGVPIVGLVAFWEEDSSFVRFTLTKLVRGTDGDPDSWVAYVRDATTGEPDYDTGATIVDNGDGTYAFTFATDVAAVTGVTYEPTLTHRVAGQIGSSSVALEAQNLWLDFVPDGSAVAYNRRIAVLSSCNECHQDLVFHGRRFQAEFCVQCHNSDLAQGEGDFAFMIHRIHYGGTFNVLDEGVSYAAMTYPQDVRNCRKCHNADDSATPEADNWRTLPNMAACDGCHDVFNPFALNSHGGGPQSNNQNCRDCHTPADITRYHTTPNRTENNPELLENQHEIVYEVISAVVTSGSNDVTVRFRILSDGTPLDITDLPAEFRDGAGNVFRYPGLLLAYAMPQGGINAPADYNNRGRNAAQPISIGLDSLSPISASPTVGSIVFDPQTGVMTATITGTSSKFPGGATMRAVGLQSYLRQDLTGNGSYDVSLHAVSDVEPVAGDAVRRTVIDPANCSRCHESLEGHGGNRVIAPGSDQVCQMCHVPNLSSSGRTLDLNHPEDSNNIKDLIHGIHVSGGSSRSTPSSFRTRNYEFVRNFGGSGNLYNWGPGGNHYVTFPRGAEVSKCTLCHIDGTYELPLAAGVLPSTVRTTGVANGQDGAPGAVSTARGGALLPNATDWINTPTASSCFYCHTSVDAWAHMTQNGALLSDPRLSAATWSNRSALGTTFEACSVCHGEGRIADVKVVHDR